MSRQLSQEESDLLIDALISQNLALKQQNVELRQVIMAYEEEEHKQCPLN
jgi:hypothetical protein